MRLTRIKKNLRGYLGRTSFFLFLVFISNCMGQTLSEYSLFASVGDSDALVRLRVLPNGQIIDPHQQYGTLVNTDGISLDTNRKYLYISCLGYGSPGGICSFTIQNDGSLLSLETITSMGRVYHTFITPNNQLLVPHTPYSSDIFMLSSDGTLIDTGNQFTGTRSFVDTLGRFVITPSIITTSGFDYYVYSINYDTKNLSLSQIIEGSGGQIYGVRFTKSGNMGIAYGVDADSAHHDVSVIWIDPLGNVTTTNQGFRIFANVYDVALTPDDRYAYISGDTTINLFSVNTVARTIADTGYCTLPPNGRSPFLFRLNDSGTFGVLLYIANDGLSWLATAFINPSDGHLTWTGYTFPIDSIYAGAGATIDIQWIPVYTTSVPEELWKELE